MKSFLARTFIHGRYLPAICAGLLLAVSFPKSSVAGFAWIAPGMMLAVALGKTGGESFRIGYVAGLTHYLVSLSWLLRIPYRWQGIPVGPAAGWFALSAFIALYPALFVWLALKLSGVKEPMPDETDLVSAEPKARWADGLREIAGWSWLRRTLWAFTCAAIWVALEMIVTRFLGGFPWNLLGASQYQIVPLIQIASFTGIYGVSFLVVWTSVSLLCAGAVIVGQPTLRSSWVREIFLPLAAVCAVFFFGFHQLSRTRESNRELRVTLVQPSIPQTLIWNPDNDLERFHEVIRLSEAALANPTDVLIWPEAATPGLPRYQREFAEPLLTLARTNKVWLIIGTDDAAVIPGATNYFNASFLINPEGRLARTYRKRSLVIFGEYIPLERWLPFMKWFTPAGGSYTAGDRAIQFEMKERGGSPQESNTGTNSSPSEAHFHPAAKTSVLICFEDVFPQLARASVEPDTDFLVNITNDGWFGEGSAQWQQAASAVFRAVENGLPLVRCSNNGLTCWVDAHGRIRQMFADATGSVYGAGFMTVKIPLREPGEQRPPTFYHQHGDWFGWGCVALAAMTLFLEPARTIRNRSMRSTSAPDAAQDP